MNFLLTALPAFSRQRQVICLVQGQPAHKVSSITEKPVSEKKNKQGKEPKVRLLNSSTAFTRSLYKPESVCQGNNTNPHNTDNKQGNCLLELWNDPKW